MKKAKTIFGSIFIFLLTLTSCSKKSPELILKKENKLSGVLNGYVQIQYQSPYKIEFEKSGQGDFYKETPYITITFKSIKPVIIPAGEKNSINIQIDLLDENNEPVISSLFGLVPRDLDSVESILISGSEEKSFKLYGYNLGLTSNDFFKEHDISKAKFMTLNSSWIHVVGR